ncbi:MAG: hypothetical protein O3B75_07205 [Planctomycetota bacterium]|nr:hypothetical protein [Planctomycetota bacterium]
MRPCNRIFPARQIAVGFNLVVMRVLGIAVAVTTLTSTAAGQSFVNWESPQVHPLATTPSGGRVLAVNTADSTLEVFDATSANGIPQFIGSISVGLDPVSVRPRTETEVWVANLMSDSISIIDLTSMRVVRTVTVGDEPCDIAFAGSPQRAFITLSQRNQVLVLDPNNPTAAGTAITLAAEDPRELATSPDGSKVYAAIFESGNHSVIIPRAQVTAAPGPYGGQNPPPNSGNQFSPPRAAGQPTAPRVAHMARKNSAGQWLDGNGRNWSSLITWDVVDHDVAIIDANTLAVSYADGMMTTVAGIAVRPDGRVTVIGTEAKNEIRFEPNLNGKFIRSMIGSFPASSPASVQIADINPHLTYATANIPVMQRLQSIGDPRAVVWNSAGTRAYACGIGSDIVIATDASGARLATYTVGEGPTGLALSIDGTKLYTLNRFGASLSTTDLTSGAELARTAFHDATPSTIRDGRRFFFDTHLTSGLGQASCASCHVDTRTDHLAWDLGDPSGAMTSFTGTCVDSVSCVDWHPLRGPVVTQTMQGIIGNEPFHWRGEKPGLEDFNSAYTNLQGADAQLTTSQMASLKSYVATITFPPNPNRLIDGALSTAVSTSIGVGNAAAGKTTFDTFAILPNAPGGNTRCVDCHPGSSGTSLEIGIPLGPVQQNRKMAQLRNIHEKTGANLDITTATKGFGFNHDAEFATLADLFDVGFAWGIGTTALTRRSNVEAYLLSFSTDTHAGVGAQTNASNGGGSGDNAARISQFVQLAGTGQVGLIVKGRVNGVARGFAFVAGSFQSDRTSEVLSPSALLASATIGSELAYTLVPTASATRLGIDRDLDGFFDRDEIDAGSDPADSASTPSQCSADIAPKGGNGIINAEDLATMLAQWGFAGSGDINGSGTTDAGDLAVLLAQWGTCQ